MCQRWKAWILLHSKKHRYDILASELRKHLNMKKIYEILEQGVEDILEESEAEGEAEK